MAQTGTGKKNPFIAVLDNSRIANYKQAQNKEVSRVAQSV
jgi:hypothetical protein